MLFVALSNLILGGYALVCSEYIQVSGKFTDQIQQQKQ